MRKTGVSKALKSVSAKQHPYGRLAAVTERNDDLVLQLRCSLPRCSFFSLPHRPSKVRNCTS